MYRGFFRFSGLCEELVLFYICESFLSFEGRSFFMIFIVWTGKLRFRGVSVFIWGNLRESGRFDFC